VATATENRIHKPSSHRALSRKALIGVLLVVGVAAILVAVPTVVVAASPPWWVTDIAVVGGGVAGAVVGGPVGAVAGALGGALLVQAIYGLSGQTSKTPSSSSQYVGYDEGIINATMDGMKLANAQTGTMNDLTLTSYYYFAQLMNSLVPRFLGNTTLNETAMGYLSGLYFAFNNVTKAAVDTFNQEALLQQQWTILNSYPTVISYATMGASFVGNTLSNGELLYITPNTNFYYVSNNSFMLTNIFNGSSYTVNQKPNYVYSNMNYEGTGTLSGYVASETLSSSSNYGIKTGIYSVSNLVQSNLVAYSPPNLYTTSNPTLVTDALSLSSAGAISVANFGLIQGEKNEVSSGNTAITTSALPETLALTLPGFSGYYGNPPASNITNIGQYTAKIMSNAYSSAQAFFTELKNLGYTSASQVPAALIMTPPSMIVPNAMLNSTFNATELQALYYAYLLQLKTWFNQTTTHQLKGNMTIDNATFTNGFVQVYGNLAMTNSTGKYYYNNTWFLPLISLGNWPYKVHTWSNITNGTPDPNWLITSGSSSGTLLNLVNATFYTEQISVNGTSVSSYTIRPVTISYVLPSTTPIGKISTGGFFTNRYGPLATWEWILIGLISLVAVAAIFERRD
jgi:hypothetical protein